MATKGTEVLGFSVGRLSQLRDRLQTGVNQGEIPGAVALVVRREEIACFEAVGYRDREAGARMEHDAIFRIASLTKPLTSLAAMMLVEEAKLSLSTPVSEYLPVLKGLQVGHQRSDGGLDLEPCRREVTILDLFRHTSGFTYGWIGNSAVKKQYQAAGIDQFVGSAGDYLKQLAELPLQFQPGTMWGYGVSTDVLGHVVETASGTTLAEFITSRITEPLGMVDTGFWVDQSKQHRIAEPQIDLATGKRPPLPDRAKRPPRFGGGGAMVSTADDYGRFCQFWLSGCTADGMHLVSRKTIELMTADHLPPDVGLDPDVAVLFGPFAPLPVFGSGFGLGFSVRTSLGRTPWHGSVGDFGWVGSSGCVFWVDPKEQLFAVLLMQAPTQLAPYFYRMRALVYQALVD